MLTIYLRAKTGYSMLMSQLMQKAREEGKSISFGQVSTMTSKKWKEMSVIEKEKFSSSVVHVNKRRKSPYNVFVKTHYQEYKNPNNPLDLSKLTAKWKSLSPEKKRQYNAE